MKRTKLLLIVFTSLIIVILLCFQAIKIYIFADEVTTVHSITEELQTKKLMVVFAHPDDESYTTGLFKDAEQEGVETALLTFTPGDAGEQQPQVCRQQFLGAVRKAEVYKSGFVLGVDYQKVFDYSDGTLQFQQMDSLVKDIETELNRYKPELVVTFWHQSGMTGHADHMTIGKATQLAFEKYSTQNKAVKAKLAYTIMPPKVLSLLGNSDMLKLQPNANFAIKADATIKTRLWKIHASQEHFVKNYTGLPTWLLYRLLNREYYFIKNIK